MRHIRVLRVFTEGDEGGNHLGVVSDLTDLDDDAMQAIAAELGYAETIFLDPPGVRIFTPTNEMPFAGHPLVGAAQVVSDGLDGASGTLRCQIGDVAYSIEGESAWVETAMPGPVTPTEDTVAEGLRLPPSRSASTVMMPLPYLVLETEDAASVAAADPDFTAMAASDLPQVYLFARDGDWVKARFFAPNFGIPEDPATGSAAIALAAVLGAEGELEGSVAISQGAEIGHPSRIDLRWRPEAVSIGGTVREDKPRSL